MNNVGAKIKELRERLNITQSELANRVGTDATSISRWETNKVKISMKYITKLAQALNTSSDYLLGNDKEMPSNLAYTNERKNQGMLIYTFPNGQKLELPPIPSSYDFLREVLKKPWPIEAAK